MAVDPVVAAEIEAIRLQLFDLGDWAAEIIVARNNALTSLDRIVIQLSAVEEPPAVWPMPVSVNLTPGPAEIQVDIAHPSTIPPEYDYMVIAWGSGSFIDAEAHERPFPDTRVITGLPIAPVNVDVGYGIQPDPVPSDKLVRATATPEPVATTGWPAAGTWDQKTAWIAAGAGTKTTLKLVGRDGTPAGCSWLPAATPPRLDLKDATLLEGWEIPGRIYVRSVTGNPDVTMRNVKAWDAFSSEAGANRVKLVEDCTFDMSPAEVIDRNWGQGNLNAMRAGFVVRRTVLRHAADNMQCSGGGLVEDTVFADMTIDPEFTHNDFIQNYDGLVSLRRCWFKQTLTKPEESGHVNGIFADSALFDIEDCSIEVYAPVGTNAWALHAGKQPATIWIRNSRVRGKIVGDVRFEANVDHVNGY